MHSNRYATKTPEGKLSFGDACGLESLSKHIMYSWSKNGPQAEKNSPLNGKAGQSKSSLTTTQGAKEHESATKWLQSDQRGSLVGKKT